MKRLGTVLVFKSDVSRQEIIKALESIRRVIDVPKIHPEWKRGKAGQVHSMNDELREYDDEWGDPVWYLP